uniref:Uncharacterized protein n=1 Tax=Arundo donax TaxID=35708 RepID=A0A0A8YE21_ARUDO
MLQLILQPLGVQGTTRAHVNLAYQGLTPPTGKHRSFLLSSWPCQLSSGV